MSEVRFKYHGNIRFILGIYLLLGLAVLLTAVFVITNYLTGRVEEEARASTEIFSRVVAQVLLSPDAYSTVILEEVAQEFRLPMIISTVEGIPLLWNGIDIPHDYEDLTELTRIDPQNPPPGPISEVIVKMHEFDAVNRPIPFRRPGEAEVQGYVHYGSTGLSNQIRYISYIQFLTVIAFMGVALVAFRYLKRSEARSIWMGMAKETAHQLGTPISSLMGWASRLRDLTERRPEAASEEGALPEEARVHESIDEMEKDISRLQKISSRFSQIGSVPKLEPTDMSEIVRDTADYFARRLPNLGSRIRIETRLSETPEVPLNRDLVEWVLENLIKNAIDAMEGREGAITVETAHDRESGRVEVRVRDQGVGMSASAQRRVFVPGYSTKKRGWGLGLPLAKRIVEEYHRGSLRVLESAEGKGSTFVAALPLSQRP